MVSKGEWKVKKDCGSRRPPHPGAWELQGGMETDLTAGEWRDLIYNFQRSPCAKSAGGQGRKLGDHPVRKNTQVRLCGF